MRELLILICCAGLSGAAPRSVRDIDWKNFSYPLAEDDGVPGDIRWMRPGAKKSGSLIDGRYVVLDDLCRENTRTCPLVTLDSVHYGALAEIKSTVGAVVLTWHSGGSAYWQYVYVYTFESGKPRLLSWLGTGSRAYQGLREASITGGDLVLTVNDPDKREGDCCSAGSIITRYRWLGSSFSAVGQPVYKNDPPSFDCAKARTPVELLVCKNFELFYLDSEVADSYQRALKNASEERKEVIRRQQAEWFADYSRTCNAPGSEEQRRECIDEYLNERVTTFFKLNNNLK
jgi:hypothetical protein